MSLHETGVSKKRRPKGMPESVQQGSRILGRTGGRPATLFMGYNNSLHPCESPLELAVGNLACLDPRVREVTSQPFTIDIVTGDILCSREARAEHRKLRAHPEVKVREYTPDFRFSLIDEQSIIVEVKDPRYAHDEQYWEKVEHAARILRSNGHQFCVISMAYEPTHPLVQNGELLRYVGQNFDDPGIDRQLDDLTEQFGDSTVALGAVSARLGLTLREAPILLLRGIVSADIASERICAAMPVQLAYGDLQHLQILTFEGNQTC